jgi:hypothetical protein
MRTSIFKTLKPTKVFAGECNVHRQKVHALFTTMSFYYELNFPKKKKKNTIL